MKSQIKSLNVKLLLCVAFLTSLSMGAFAGTQTFLYDANGNLINDSYHCYKINAANQLANITDCGTNVLAQYWYDYTGRKVKAIEGGVTIYYPFPEYEERHYPDGTNETISYFFANGELIARKQKDRQGVTKMFYYHGDHLGSTAVITDEQGNVVERVKYYPYGKVLSRTPQDPLNTRLYNGKEFSGITGLYYYEARYYRPDPPGFTQPDPIIPDVYDPQTFNRYSYAKNNPVKYTDPSGHFVVLPYLIAYGSLMGGGYIAGSAWGVGEYAINRGEYNPLTLYNSEEVHKLSSERGTEGAIMGATIATLGLIDMRAGMKTNVPESVPDEAVVESTASTAIQRATQAARTIEDKKIADYLLKPLAKNDKSGGFGTMGYSSSNADTLRTDLMSQAANNLKNAVVTETQYGTKYEVSSVMAGPNGATGRITTVWQIDKGSSTLRLVTSMAEPFSGTE